MKVQYDTRTGEVLQYLLIPDFLDKHYKGDGTDLLEVPHTAQRSPGYVSGGKFYPRPDAPSPHHEWDCELRQWVVQDDGVEEARAELLTLVVAEYDTRRYAPTDFEGVFFDADARAREYISGMLGRLQRGACLPPAWSGWRDLNNDLHWCELGAEQVLAKLNDLATMIEDREQALLTALWCKKAEVAALTDLVQIQTYRETCVETGWTM